MSMSSVGAVAGTFRIGNVFGRTIGVLSRHFVLFVLVTAAAQLPSVILAFFSPGGRPRPGVTGLTTVIVVTWLVILLLIPITQTILYHAAFQDMLGRPIRLGDSLALAVRRFFPILGAFSCMMLLVGIGFVLLVVPGIILAAMLAVTVPASVVEGLGPFASIRRSARLTKGNRWRILGIGLLVLVISLVSGGITVMFRLGIGPEGGAVAGFILQSLVGAFTSIVAAVMYHDLRVANEGVDTERIAAVFD